MSDSSGSHDFIFRCIPNAALKSQPEAEATTRSSTNQRTTNSRVNGGVSGRPATVPTGQHYAQDGPSELQKQQAQQKAAATAAKQKSAQEKAAATTAKHQAAAQAKAQKAAAHAKSTSGSKGSSAHSAVAQAEKRTPKGQAGGGRFAPGGARAGNAGKSGHSYAQDQKDPHEQDMYNSAMSSTGAAQKKYLAGLNNQDLQGLTGIAYSSKTSDPKVVAMRIAVANEMAKRGFDVKDYGALGGGLRKPGAPAARPAAHKPVPTKPAGHRTGPAPKRSAVPAPAAGPRYGPPTPTTRGNSFNAHAE